MLRRDGNLGRTGEREFGSLFSGFVGFGRVFFCNFLFCRYFWRRNERMIGTKCFGGIGKECGDTYSTHGYAL